MALKVLHPELVATLGPERFQRESRMAARLQHPHIISVHDSGETEGQLWFTIPLGFVWQLRASPDDAQLHMSCGLVLAYGGRNAEVVLEGEKGVALLPITKDAYSGANTQHLLVRIYILAGEREKALDRLERLLKIPYYLSPGWLRIDPTFAPLRGNPRFERLVSGS